MCKWLADNGFTSVPLHFSRFYPMYKLEQLPPTPVDLLNKASLIAAEEGLKYVYIGNVPGSEIADTKCPSCGVIVVKREGFRIVSNTLQKGNCPSCGKRVDGIWE